MIVGTGFSGSTLLSFLLNAHPPIASVGEASGPFRHAVDQSLYLCSCGATLADCPFWTRVSEAMRARGIDFGPNRWRTTFVLSRRGLANHLLTRSLRSNLLDGARDALVQRVPPWGRALREVAARCEALAESILEVTGARVFADASKDPARVRHLEHLSALRPHALHLVRDSPGFVASRMHNTRTSLEEGVRDWNRMAGHIQRLFAILPADRRLRLRYEDLCRDPLKELARICAFVGVEAPSGPLDFRAVEHHVIGNRMRLGTSSEIRLDERWRERLTPAQVDHILRRTAAARRICGYA
jgi:hypothetical protein